MTDKVFRKNVSIEGQITGRHFTHSKQIELAGFLDAINFTHFCTFTMSKPTSIGSCRRIAERVYQNIGGRSASSMFWASEKHELTEGAGSNRFHFHALLRTPMRPIDIFNWYYPRYGRCQIIDNSDPARMLSASRYVSKYITKEIADYDIYINPQHLNISL